MIYRILLISLSLVFGACSFNSQPLTKGMVITQSTQIKKGVYKLSGTGISEPLLVIQGEGITVDFNQAVLQGSDSVNSPNAYKGLAILVKGGKNITLKNLKARGYKVALMAEGTQNLTLENCDFSYNYKQQLNSTPEREDISDWMSFHHNENDEWLRYGAAIYLKDCDHAVLNHNLVTQGQNALMLVRSNHSIITNNHFNFNSGIGIGMYRSSNNTVAYNNLNFNVRGYSHKVYSRGQDSAGILVYEQSNENIFYMNSVTHSGDGFFLWAGQSTMDTGKGGCNDNLLLKNDFSYAPTNGIEVTFSRNKIVNNLIQGCTHGVWGGYSYESQLIGNRFDQNKIDIAIEHGQQNQILKNNFTSSEVGIKLWQREKQPADWGYAQNRNTQSQAYQIISNTFKNVITPLQISHTTDLKIYNNALSTLYLSPFDKSVTDLDTLAPAGEVLSVNEDFSTYIPDVKSSIDPFADSAQFKGRDKIIMTQWGPYSYMYPFVSEINHLIRVRNLTFKFLGQGVRGK